MPAAANPIAAKELIRTIHNVMFKAFTSTIELTSLLAPGLESGRWEKRAKPFLLVSNHNVSTVNPAPRVTRIT
jgi:hypothetical protein